MSPEGRRAALEDMASSSFDLLVVGGGITGAGIARDAALRGMRVALVEREDFGSGTSSRSSKIVHGGVRYLEYLQFGMVRESARERRVLQSIAPHLVHPLPFLYPVFEVESLLKMRAGLRLFDAFAGNARSERSRKLSPSETRSFLPGLRDPLRGSVIYPEYITDDARLTLANIASAAEHGARVANHVAVTGFTVRKGRVIGAEVLDGIENRTFDIRARVTVNAVGPWVPELLERSGIDARQRIIPSKGIHFLLRRSRLPVRAASFLRSRSGRQGLVMPRGDWVYVGTSDEEYHDRLDEVRATREEVEELLAMAADCFPEAGLGIADVRATWAGIRPLIHEPGKSTREMSRHDEIWTEPPGLVTVAGGKLTTYRPMARRVLEAVARSGAVALPGTDRTADVPLPGTPTEPLSDFSSRTSEILRRKGVPEGTRTRLGFLYGSELDRILAYGREDNEWLEPIAEGVPALKGEVRLAVEEGMALTLADVMDRRMALLLFSENGGLPGAEAAATIMAGRLDWDGKRLALELERYRHLAHQHGPPAPPSGIDTTGASG
jgi:glycerol-3-phosphate dehydrogenase